MGKYILIISLLFALVGSSCKKGKNNPESCNGSSTRREVKLTIDNGAVDISPVVTVIGVKEFGELDVPVTNKDSERQSLEKQLFTITAKVHKLSKHRDGDWKVKLTDENDHFVNCEAPNTGCKYFVDALFADKMKTAREWIESEQNNLEGRTVTITGVGFIDIDHKYPRNAALNNLEIHPILEIHY